MRNTSPSPLRLLPPEPDPLSTFVEAGRLVELSSASQAHFGHARTTTAVSLLLRAQQEGETSAWIQPEYGPLFPPDLEQSGIDVEALVVIQVPRDPSGAAAPHRLCKASEILLRSGAFGFIVLDLSHGLPAGGDAWQGRLLGLSRQHQCRVVVLTEKPSHADSLGPLVGLRVEPKRIREVPGRFLVEHDILKNKSGAALCVATDVYRGPWGLM